MESFFEFGFFDILTPIRKFCACGNLCIRDDLVTDVYLKSVISTYLGSILSSGGFASDLGPKISIPWPVRS
jgi:hypothetical protein